MYQPYPGTHRPEVNKLAEDQRPPAPDSVLNAIKFMYAGMVATVVDFAVGVTLSKVAIALAILLGAVSLACWILAVLGCRKGKNWTRITGTLAFAVLTLGQLVNISRSEPGVIKILELVIWVCGLGATVLLWRPSSNAFFKGTDTSSS